MSAHISSHALRGSQQSAKLGSGAPCLSLQWKGLSGACPPPPPPSPSIPKDEFLKKVELFSDEQCQTHFRVKGASRLTCREGTASEAIKVTFLAQTLPTLMRINRSEYSLRPFVAEVLWRYQCHWLGHLIRQCKAKPIRASKRRCVNCGGEHSAAYLRCTARK